MPNSFQISVSVPGKGILLSHKKVIERIHCSEQRLRTDTGQVYACVLTGGSGGTSRTP